MANEYQLTLNDYYMMIKRRAALIAIVFVAVSAITVVVAMALPPVYQSTGTILVESQQIPSDLVPQTITTFADERIQIIKQRVMTRENLFRIVEKYELFEDRGSTPMSELLDQMRDKIQLELISADTGRRNTTTIAFKLSFEHRSPGVAHGVANELVTLFLQENAKASTERATETTEFITREAEKLKTELESLEAQVAAYKQQHGSALPEHLDLRMSMLQRAEGDLRDVTREYKTTQEELRFLDVELAAAKSGVATTTADIVLSPAQELEQLKAQYVRLTGTYTKTHPDVRNAARKIAALEKTVASTPQEDTPVPTGGLEVARIQAKVDAANSRLASLDAQHKRLQGRIHQLEAQILQTPQVERGLITLMRDHENAQKKYEEVRAKQIDAQMAQSLQQDSKAERFALLEPPLRPDVPVSPDRPKILLLGLLLAAGGSGGLAFLLEMLNQRIRGAGALMQLMRQAPLVVIPYITTQDELAKKKSTYKKFALITAIAVLVFVALVHFLYQPLNILFLKLWARLG